MATVESISMVDGVVTEESRAEVGSFVREDVMSGAITVMVPRLSLVDGEVEQVAMRVLPAFPARGRIGFNEERRV